MYVVDLVDKPVGLNFDLACSTLKQLQISCECIVLSCICGSRATEQESVPRRAERARVEMKRTEDQYIGTTELLGDPE
jgi:hypothetical protein